MKQVSNMVDGYAAAIHFLPGNEEFFVTDPGGKTCCVAADGYQWLVLLPLHQYWCLTAIYNEHGEIIEWYFDITKENFVDEHGMPCMDDLFLDWVLFPNGEGMLLDEDELQEAFQNGEINASDMDFAYRQYTELLHSEWRNIDFLHSTCEKMLRVFRGTP